MQIKRLLLALFVVTGLSLAFDATAARACGGFFCQNSPVDQAAERIVFSVNGDGTITSLIEIAYVGSAEDFSWILPVPSAIGADDLAVPEGGDEVFAELHELTDVRILRPEPPECAEDILAAQRSADDAAGGVEVFASGEVGPFGFDVIGSDDPDALIDWLRDNSYQVEEPMVPLIDVYVEERFAFVAMRLLDGETSESITPIEITYEADLPAIPLRLTAVAANDDMPIYTWIFAEAQAVPENFGHMEIATEEITLFAFGGNDYQALVTARADAFENHAFITEFAGRTDSLDFSSGYLRTLADEQPYLTRLTTFISPDQMTRDPAFFIDAGRPDVSNVRDATELDGLFQCERDGEGRTITFDVSDAIDPRDGDGVVVAATPTGPDQSELLRNAIIFTVLTLVFVIGSFVYAFRRDDKASNAVVSTAANDESARRQKPQSPEQSGSWWPPVRRDR